MTLGDIIKKYRLERNLTMDSFAEKAGLSKGYISMLEKNENPRTKKPIIPTLDTYNSIAKALNIPLNKLICMVDPASEISLTDKNDECEDDIYSYENIMPLPKMKKVPLVGTIACGTPILAQENIDGYVDVPIEYNVDFCLRAKGDSMINARIFDGDVVYIHKQEDVENGEIAAVLIDDEATLKRIYKSADRITLRAENPTFDDIVYTKDDNKTITILGKALVFLSGVR